jgi:DNA-binding NarL/FixJ family response regulator
MGARVLIVDHHAAFRMFARRLLTADGFDVGGEAADGLTALAAAMELLRDVVLVDVQLPGIDGLQVAAALARQPSPPVVVLTSSRARG